MMRIRILGLQNGGGDTNILGSSPFRGRLRAQKVIAGIDMGGGTVRFTIRAPPPKITVLLNLIITRPRVPPKGRGANNKGAAEHTRWGGAEFRCLRNVREIEIPNMTGVFVLFFAFSGPLSGRGNSVGRDGPQGVPKSQRRYWSRGGEFHHLSKNG